MCEKPLTMHAHSTRGIETERRMTMKLLLPKTLWFGTIGVATLLVSWTPSCKAQEVSPAHFTQTGVEDAYPVQKPLPKKSAKVQIASNSIPAGPSSRAVDRKKNARRAARRQEVVLAQGI